MRYTEQCPVFVKVNDKYWKYLIQGDFMKPNKIIFVKSVFMLMLVFCLFISCMSTPSRVNRIELEKFRQEDAQQRLSNWPIPYKELLIPTRFGTTYALESGNKEGDVLILVHAMGLNSLTWTFNVKSWAKDYRVIALDTIGDQGKSVVRRDWPKTGEEYADWMLDITESLSIEKAHIMGCSMGGWIALNSVMKYPNMFDSLILNSPAAGIPAKTTWSKYLKKIIFTSSSKKHREAAQFLLGDGLARRDWEDYMVHVVSDIKGAKLGMPTNFKLEVLSHITTPVLIIVGENEVIYKKTDELFENAKTAWPSVKTTLIPDAGHLGHYDNPSFVNQIVLDFLKGTETQAVQSPPNKF